MTHVLETPPTFTGPPPSKRSRLGAHPHLTEGDVVTIVTDRATWDQRLDVALRLSCCPDCWYYLGGVALVELDDMVPFSSPISAAVAHFISPTYWPPASVVTAMHLDSLMRHGERFLVFAFAVVEEALYLSQSGGCPMLRPVAEALKLAELLAERFPDEPAVAHLLSRAHAAHALVRVERGDLAQALEALAQAAIQLERAGAGRDPLSQVRLLQARAAVSMEVALQTGDGLPEDPLELYLECLRLLASPRWLLVRLEIAVELAKYRRRYGHDRHGHVRLATAELARMVGRSVSERFYQGYRDDVIERTVALRGAVLSPDIRDELPSYALADLVSVVREAPQRLLDLAPEAQAYFRLVLAELGVLCCLDKEAVKPLEDACARLAVMDEESYLADSAVRFLIAVEKITGVTETDES